MEIFGRQFEILQPAWLAGLALLPLLVVYSHWSLARLSRGRRALLLSARALLLVALLLALCQLKVTWPSGRQMVVFALDQSASIPQSSRSEAETFLEQAASQAGGNRVAYLPFAASAGRVQVTLPQGKMGQSPFAGTARDQASPGARLRTNGDCPLFPSRQGTNLAAAVIAARAQIPADYVPRIVLLTDGNQTEGDVLRAVRSAGAPIDVVPLASAGQPEVYVAAVRTPGQVQDGVPFAVDVLVHSDHDDEGTVELSQSCCTRNEMAQVRSTGFSRKSAATPPEGGTTNNALPTAWSVAPVARRKVKVMPGDNRIPFTCTLRGQPSADLTARIEGFRDTIAENNSATAMVFSTGRPKALVLAHDASSIQHLGPILTGQRIDFDLRPAQGAGLPRTLEELENYDLLILANVPAADLPQDRQESIRRYVRDFGGGLVVIGGDQAFTPGGYHGTTLEEVLPVWCDFRRRQPRPSLAMVLVLDRSGSMEGSSIRLAKEAIRRAVEMLEPTDQVGVLVFDDTTRWISPIAPCVDKRPILQKIATITAGGETDMGPAMDKAYLALNECFAKLKHVIIMTDGVSHPGDFEAQAKKMAEAGITVSMVALGPQAAREEAEDIARLGKGRHYFCVDPADIPRIFALETASASRVGIVEQPFFAKVAGASSAMPASEIRTAPSLLGYVGTRPKPTSQLVLSSIAGDPLLIWWRYGLGVSVAFTSDLQSRWAAPWLRWQGLGRFWGRLIHHATRRVQAQDFALDLKRRGTRIELTLDAVDPGGMFVNGAKVTLHIVGPDGKRGQSPFAGTAQRVLRTNGDCPLFPSQGATGSLPARASPALADKPPVAPVPLSSEDSIEVPQVAPGRYATSLEAAAPGTYSFEIRLEYQGRLVYLERRGLATGFADELRVRPANEELLQSIASLSGGRYRPPATAIFAPTSQTVPRTEELWRYFLAAAVIILMLDVVIRRTVRERASGTISA